MTDNHAETMNEARSDRQPGGTWFLHFWVTAAAFGTYFCMYGFRKPYTAATYADVAIWAGLSLKTLLVISQTLGYLLSKFIGIRVVAELPPRQRALAILGLIGMAELALLLFAFVPAPWNCLCLFLNGLPLGMVFGLVLSFLEGRRATEALAAGLCTSFIVADGFTKTVGSSLLQAGVSETWMPFTAGLAFAPVLVVSVWLLSRTPPPTASDIEHRTARPTLSRDDRHRFLGRYAFGLAALTGAYILITVLRSIRADFSPEIWLGLGFDKSPGVFTRSELWVALGVIIANGLTVLIHDNRRAFFASLGIAIGGLALLPVALVGLRQGWLGGFPFMVLMGLGLYLPYVAVHTTVFERLIAMTRDRSTVGFLLTFADAFGYVGVVVVMLTKEVLHAQGVFERGGFLEFFTTAAWVISGLGLLGLMTVWGYFSYRETSRVSVAVNVVTAAE